MQRSGGRGRAGLGAVGVGVQESSGWRRLLALFTGCGALNTSEAEVERNEVDKEHSGRQHEFQKRTYKRITRCDVCNEFLTGHTHQGLRCLLCKTNVHMECMNTTHTCLPSKPRRRHRHGRRQGPHPQTEDDDDDSDLDLQ